MQKSGYIIQIPVSKKNADIYLPAFHILVFDLEFKFSVLVGTNHGIAVFDRGIENFLA